MKRVRLLIACVFLLLVLGSVLFWVCSVLALSDFSDAYASDWTAAFVIEHLKSSRNTWPASWNDLRDEYDRLAEPAHYAWTFSELQQRVHLRFDVTAAHVRDAETPLIIFQLASGKQVGLGGDPNLRIREFLRSGKE